MEPNMNRPTIEQRSDEDSQRRAIVIDLSMAKLLGSILAAFAIGGFCVGIWIFKQDAAIEGLAKRMDALDSNLASRAGARDAQFAALGSRIGAVEDRTRPLEITVASIANSMAFVRDRVDSGLADIGNRLDRIEDRLPGVSPDR
jgi:hypothetical protein